jgi:hypothetical protein
VHCKLEHYGAMHQPSIVMQFFLGGLSDTLFNNPSQILGQIIERSSCLYMKDFLPAAILDTVIMI